ncbi:glycosyltransferase [Cetobacterium sp.]|uniref:glycosyltransferase family 2 protein n=1 Tax=Cetobacterium sp. TaxID=2071632 RepID=UPI0025C2E230|nr:glycosyltransferase [Cetobacterium sp.]
MQKIYLTIAIPTYNRENQLKRTLNELRNNKNKNKIKILILDNCSEYDIFKLKKEFFDLNIEIKKNNCNIGGNANIARCFEIVETEWMWVLSDDDLPVAGVIDKILKDIEISDDKVILLKYSSEVSMEFESKEIVGLENLIYFLNKMSPESRFSNLLFISTSVYRVSQLKKYVVYAYQYTNAYFPQVAILFFFLEKHSEYKVKFLKELTVNLVRDKKDSYIGLLVGLGILTSTKNMIFNISVDADEKMRSLFTLFTKSYRSNFLALYLSNYQIKTKKEILKELYNYSKKDYNYLQKLEFYILYYALSNSLLIKLLKRISIQFKKKIESDRNTDLYWRI